jgi:predicted metal-dependent HD superfamily phosphohydrolase
MNLEKIFNDLLLKIGFEAKEIVFLWQELEKAYSSKTRHYHNLLHLEEMLELFENCKNELQNPNEILFALFYHDFVYEPTKKDNELKSAAYAVGILNTNDQLDKQLIFDLIIATQLHQYNPNQDINWLIDFDLKILSKNWEAYKIYCQQIRKEYKIYPDFLYNPGRKKALQHFLKSEFIFQTDLFREKYEAKARENIQREIDELL